MLTCRHAWPEALVVTVSREEARAGSDLSLKRRLNEGSQRFHNHGEGPL